MTAINMSELTVAKSPVPAWWGWAGLVGWAVRTLVISKYNNWHVAVRAVVINSGELGWRHMTMCVCRVRC